VASVSLRKRRLTCVESTTTRWRVPRRRINSNWRWNFQGVHVFARWANEYIMGRWVLLFCFTSGTIKQISIRLQQNPKSFFLNAARYRCLKNTDFAGTTVFIWNISQYSVYVNVRTNLFCLYTVMHGVINSVTLYLCTFCGGRDKSPPPPESNPDSRDVQPVA
jgi:hypothetical protein